MGERIKQVNQLIKKELSQIIIREIEFPAEVYATLTRVETLANLRQSKIYISVMPENKIKDVLKILDNQIYQLQQKLNRRLKMRPVPRIYFVQEKETVAAGKIEEVLAKLKKEKK